MEAQDSMREARIPRVSDNPQRELHYNETLNPKP